MPKLKQNKTKQLKWETTMVVTEIKIQINGNYAVVLRCFYFIWVAFCVKYYLRIKSYEDIVVCVSGNKKVCTSCEKKLRLNSINLFILKLGMKPQSVVVTIQLIHFCKNSLQHKIVMTKQANWLQIRIDRTKVNLELKTEENNWFPVFFVIVL